MAGKEEKDGDVEWGFADENVFFSDHASDPGGDNEDGEGVDKDHFGKLEEFGEVGVPEKGGEDEEEVKEIDGGVVEIAGELAHGGSSLELKVKR